MNPDENQPKITNEPSIQSLIQKSYKSDPFLNEEEKKFGEQPNSDHILEEKKKPSYKKKGTVEKIEIMNASHKHRFEKMHSPLNLYNTFSPTHFSPKNISPLKKKPSRFANSSSIISLKTAAGGSNTDFDQIVEQLPREMTFELKTFLLNAFKGHFIFGPMDQDILENFLSKMKCFYLMTGQVLLNKGQTSEFIYIIEKGLVKSINDKDEVQTLYKSGNLLFDDLFFNNHPSNLKFVGSENTTVWGMPISQIALIILQITEKKYNENRAFIDPISLFSKLTDEQKDSLAYNMNTLKFKKGTVIIEEDKEGQNFYILKTGLLIKNAKGQFVHYLKPGDCFGENVFLKKLRNYTVLVESDTAECLSIKQKAVVDLFGEDFEKVIYKNLVRSAIKHSDKLSRLTSMQLDQLMNLINYRTYSKDEQIRPEKTTEKCMIYLLLDGKLDSFNGKTEYSEGFIIGEDYIDDPYQSVSCYFAKEDVVIGEFNLKELERELGGNLLEILEKNSFSHESLILFQKNPETGSSTLKIKLKAEDIQVLKVLGDGFSGIVLMVEYEGQLFALKVISKGWIIEQELEEYIRNEKEIYMFIDFEFITRLCYTFKDELSIYFLLEFVNGMELFTHLCNCKVLSSETARFYIATLILCLQYLHNKGILFFIFMIKFSKAVSKRNNKKVITKLSSFDSEMLLIFLKHYIFQLYKF